MKKYVFAIIEIDGQNWGCIFKWELKPWYLRIFSRYKYGYLPFGLSNKVEEQENFYNQHYSHIKV